ncbi:hypothetical protein [Thioalkalivibrio thiocyanodenitrificans]|uniref:hypothetical protein n=1 Tax=Thioalkalivibrio thiocyanodenitrificans TaxID=243063 RepID=UPI00036A3A43|nr:hypothetical protein [Thioalkalivibrio thiocyanodenitrificans]
MARTRYKISIDLYADGDEWELKQFKDVSDALHTRSQERDRLVKVVASHLDSLACEYSISSSSHDVSLSDEEQTLFHRLSQEENKKEEAEREEYKKISDQLGIKRAIWSMEHKLLHQKEPAFKGLLEVIYDGHWGEAGAVFEAVADPTWRDLFQVADRLISKSGDDHHVFIEAFLRRGDKLKLCTGS